MSHSQNFRRFKANPVEVAILSIITLIFFNSLYDLLYVNKGFHPAALTPLSANPISEGRHLASISQSLLTWNIDCETNPDKNTLSTKVRLNGPFCGIDSTHNIKNLNKANIVNTSNQYSATVFTDVDSGKFSTDYIPLNPGKNSIHVEFSYLNGKIFSQDLVVNKD